MENLIQTLAISFLPVVLAITLHEAAHGYVARALGDDTAEREGRITLNPLRHIDPWGTVLLPLLLHVLTAGKFVFGYAKPVPVNAARLDNPRRDMVWVALAGPMSNLFQAIFWGLMLKIVWVVEPMEYSLLFAAISRAGILINLVLMVLNLLPILPLDGGRILAGLLPISLAREFANFERFGFMILLGLMFSGLLGQWMAPLVSFSDRLLLAVLNLY